MPAPDKFEFSVYYGDLAYRSVRYKSGEIRASMSAAVEKGVPPGDFNTAELMPVIPTTDEWLAFFSVVDSIGAWHWQAGYTGIAGEYNVHWSLLLEKNGKRIESRGMNAYPGNQGCALASNNEEHPPIIKLIFAIQVLCQHRLIFPHYFTSGVSFEEVDKNVPGWLMIHSRKYPTPKSHEPQLYFLGDSAEAILQHASQILDTTSKSESKCMLKQGNNRYLFDRHDGMQLLMHDDGISKFVYPFSLTGQIWPVDVRQILLWPGGNTAEVEFLNGHPETVHFRIFDTLYALNSAFYPRIHEPLMAVVNGLVQVIYEDSPEPVSYRDCISIGNFSGRVQRGWEGRLGDVCFNIYTICLLPGSQEDIAALDIEYEKTLRPVLLDIYIPLSLSECTYKVGERIAGEAWLFGYICSSKVKPGLH